MKKLTAVLATALSAMTLLTGCIGLSIGGGSKSAPSPTTGQELMDLQRAKDAGTISDAEFQAQKAKVLSRK